MVVVASLGLTGLSACRSEPSVAAYIGHSGRITKSRVDAVYDEVRHKLQPAGSKPVVMPITRADVVSMLVGSQLIDKLAAEQGVTAPADLQEAPLSAALGLPADSEYLRLYAKWRGLISALRAKAAQPGDVTDAELRELFDSLVGIQDVDPATPFEQFKAQLAQSQNMAVVQQTVAVREEIVKESAQLNITINPRYQPARLTLLDTQTTDTKLHPLMTAPIGPTDQQPPVTDAR